MVLTHSRGQSPERPGATILVHQRPALGPSPWGRMQPCSFGTSWWDWGFAHRLPKGLCHHVVGLCDKVSTLHSSGSSDKEITGSSPRLCRYNQNPQLLMGLMKGQPPGKHLRERDLGALVDTSLKPHWTPTLRGKEQQQPSGKLLPESWVEGGFPSPVPSTGETILDWCVQSWSSQGKKAIPEWTQRRATKITKGLEPLYCEERLRQLGLFRLEKAQGESYQFVQIPDEGEERKWSQSLLSCIQW